MNQKKKKVEGNSSLRDSLKLRCRTKLKMPHTCMYVYDVSIVPRAYVWRELQFFGGGDSSAQNQVNRKSSSDTTNHINRFASLGFHISLYPLFLLLKREKKSTLFTRTHVFSFPWHDCIKLSRFQGLLNIDVEEGSTWKVGLLLCSWSHAAFS